MQDSQQIMIEVWDHLLVQVDVQPDGCWLWMGSVNNRGYGRVGPKRQGTRLAHRIAYSAANGVPAPGYVVDHTCHNADESCTGGPTCTHRRCCNPDHLEAVLPTVNQDRSPVVARRRVHKAECIRGHLLAGDNINVRRQCRECKRIRDHIRWAAIGRSRTSSPRQEA